MLNRILSCLLSVLSDGLVDLIVVIGCQVMPDISRYDGGNSADSVSVLIPATFGAKVL